MFLIFIAYHLENKPIIIIINPLVDVTNYILFSSCFGFRIWRRKKIDNLSTHAILYSHHRPLGWKLRKCLMSISTCVRDSICKVILRFVVLHALHQFLMVAFDFRMVGRMDCLWKIFCQPQIWLNIANLTFPGAYCAPSLVFLLQNFSNIWIFHR